MTIYSKLFRSSKTVLHPSTGEDKNNDQRITLDELTDYKVTFSGLKTSYGADIPSFTSSLDTLSEFEYEQSTSQFLVLNPYTTSLLPPKETGVYSYKKTGLIVPFGPAIGLVSYGFGDTFRFRSLNVNSNGVLKIERVNQREVPEPQLVSALLALSAVKTITKLKKRLRECPTS
ncbi:hypothetical protein F7734_11455 [Scytonema sp. UIC 10036]|uniref:hypothetical protein n=1 Tax=Scytonema sp. UIC 10036 TaxID=2304196 RepID=UPI0012DAF29A|nr:hypothetical protein [Scytonema sp. UIC 10036]MUG93020.1 hypothetical protein [Scytonema sp. UIC 10036]